MNVSGRSAWVLGADDSARAAASLLAARGARVTPVLEFPVDGSVVTWPDLAVTSARWPAGDPLTAELVRRGVPILSEVELGFRNALCLNVTVSGTVGTSSCARLIQAIMEGAQRKAALADDGTDPGLAHARPFSAWAGESAALDFIVASTPLPALGGVGFLRPAVAVLTSLAPRPGVGGGEAVVQLAGRLFQNQQAFDWAVVQTEALARLRAGGVEIPSKVVTYSATSRESDLFLDRGLLVSRLEGWAGPLLDMARGRVTGLHNAENLMAALAVGRILRIPLEMTARTLLSIDPLPGRHQLIRRLGGVDFVDDSHSTHLECLRQALESATGGSGGHPNLILIAGGEVSEGDAYALGPLLSRRVKRVFLLGRAEKSLRSAWSLFTPCSTCTSLLEAVSAAAAAAVSGDIVLFSPACSGSETFVSVSENGAGGAFREAVFSFKDPGANRAGAGGGPLEPRTSAEGGGRS